MRQQYTELPTVNDGSPVCSHGNSEVHRFLTKRVRVNVNVDDYIIVWKKSLDTDPIGIMQNRHCLRLTVWNTSDC